jgi:very-short-patch-repair endonuclease
LVIKRRIKQITTNHARSLRRNMTDAERMLWKAVRNKQIAGYRFRRQYPIGIYIADFACLEKKCVIELDGGQHQTQLEQDDLRTHYLHKQGWIVLRFWNNDVLSNVSGVLSMIVSTLKNEPPS